MADLIRLKLEHYTRLSADDVQLLSRLSTLNIRQIQPRRDIMREGEQPKVVNLILDGWAIRHKMLEDGRRQILAFLVPGDFCDTKNFVLSEMDHSVGALTAVTVAQIPNEMIQDIERNWPRLSQALNWDLLVQLAIQREWTLNVGQRSAIERISHLICELFTRMKTVGLCHDGVCSIPATQTDLSEATGVTPVHVNRTLQEMRARGLIEWKGREVRVPDMDALRRVGMFNEAYLHLQREGAHLDANE